MQTAASMLPSPPPPLRWSSCSMFMVATDQWTDGHNDQIETTGEQQLNTPEPVDIRGFEYDGSLGGLGPTNDPRNANSKNHINKSSITTMNGEEHSSIIGHGNKREQPFEFKLIPATSPSSPWATSDFSTSWQFERCPEETVLSPEMSYLSPHQSPSGVPSPDTSSGVGSETDEFETSVDFNKDDKFIEVGGQYINYTTSLTEEIEQLSESYYCKAEDLISIENPAIEGTVAVPPFFLKVLQEEVSNASDGTPSLPVSNGTVYDTHPSIVTKFLIDAAKEDEDCELEKAEYDVAKATAITPATLQCDTLDLKTQTQLEHNYTIKLPFLEAGSPGPILTTNNTLVKEQHSLKPRDTIAILPPLEQTPKRIQPPGIKRQLFQRKMRTDMAVDNKLKLKIPTPNAPIVAPVGILNTPDLTNQVLELEAEAEILSAEDQFDLLTYISSGTDYDVVPLSPVEEKPSVPKEEPTVQPESTICPDTLSKLLSNPSPIKRKLPIITLDNLEELTSSTTPKKFRSTASSTASSVCGDSVSEASSSGKKRRGRPPKQSSLHPDRAEYQHLNEEDLRYREQRDKNNEASRKSRINRRDRELKLEHEANALNQEHRELENEEQKLIRDCARWRRAVMRLALL